MQTVVGFISTVLILSPSVLSLLVLLQSYRKQAQTNLSSYRPGIWIGTYYVNLKFSPFSHSRCSVLHTLLATLSSFQYLKKANLDLYSQNFVHYLKNTF